MVKTKICSHCKKEKPVSEFYKNISCKDSLNYNCKECQDRYSKQQVEMKPCKYWAINTIKDHKRKDYILDISLNELEQLAKQTKNCFICGNKLKWEQGKGKKDNSPSLDRENSDIVLNMNNIKIICLKCNRIKNNRTMKEFIDYCEKVYKKFKRRKNYD